MIELTQDRISEMFSYGISTGFYTILATGLIGFTINKFIKLMTGGNET
jgi:hypothetical protein